MSHNSNSLNNVTSTNKATQKEGSNQIKSITSDTNDDEWASF